MVNIRIKDIPIYDRPRERLLNSGVKALSNEELLAIILKTGTKQTSAKELAHILLAHIKDINNLKYINYHDLKNIKGIGASKACSLVALVELSERMNQLNIINNIKFNSPKIVFEHFKYINKNLQEKFYCLYLDNHKRIIKEKLLFIGTNNQSIVHPREIFKEAYLINASAIICIHNHPSNVLEPSIEDINLTNKISQIGILTGVCLLDHIIVGDNNYYSFMENGKI